MSENKEELTDAQLIKQLTDRLDAVLAREKFKEHRIQELEGIIKKLQKEGSSNNITVTHELSKDAKRTLLSAAVLSGPGRNPSKWYNIAKTEFENVVRD